MAPGSDSCSYLQAFLSGLASDEERTSFENHLPECSDCLARLEGARKSDPLNGTFVDWLKYRDGRKREPAPPPTAMVDYEIGEELGRGGMGVVYRARQKSLNRRVALKMILGGSHAGPAERARLRAEMQAAARLVHPNIVQTYQVGEENGVPFLSMELVEEGSLAQLLRRNKALPPREAARLVEVLAGAVAHAHDHKIVHRDLKPANVLLARSGRPEAVRLGTNGDAGSFEPKIADFGLAKTLDGTAPSTVGTVIGTPSYMAPEQAAQGRARELADVYSLGAILYECLTGQPPFMAATPFDTVLRVIHEEPARPCRLNSQVPRDLETVCLKCLAKEPHRRYRGARELAEDLRRYADGKPIMARPVGAVGRLLLWSWRKPGLAGAIAACLIVLAVGFAAVSWQWRRAEANFLRAEDNFGRAEENARAENAANAELRAANVKLDLSRKEADAKRHQAEVEKQIAQAVQNFLQYDLLRQADPLSQADRLLELGNREFQTVENPTIKELLNRAATELTTDKLEKKFPGQPLVQASLLHTVGYTYLGVGDSAKASSHLERARALFQSHGEAGDPRILTSTMNLATAHYSMGKFDQALPLCQDVSERMQAAFGPDAPQTLVSKINLAECYQAADMVKKAVALNEENLAVCKEKLPLHYPLTLTCQHNLATGYQALGRIDEALKLYEETFRIRQEKFGLSDPRTLVSMDGLAKGLLAAKRSKEAVPLFDKSLELREMKFGPKHPMTLAGIHNLGAAYREARDLKKAVPLLEKALKLRREVLAPGDSRTLNTIYVLGLSYKESAVPDRAAPLLQEAFDAMKTSPGPNDSRMLEAMKTLASAYLAIGQPDKALPLFDNYVGRKRNLLGAFDPVFADQLLSIGVELINAKQIVQAEKVLRESHHIRSKIAPDHWTTHDTGSLFSMALLAQQKFEEAELILLTSWEGLKRNESALPVASRNRLLRDAEGRLLFLLEATRPRTNTSLKGRLTEENTSNLTKISLKAGHPVVITMQSTQFNTLLRLQDGKGKLLTENDDIDKANKNFNSRVVFIPKTDGTCHIVATSFQQTGRGEYQIAILQFEPAKSK